MTARQDMAIQLPFEAEPLDVVVEHGDERFGGRLLARQAHGGVLRTSERPPVGSILVFYVPGADGGAPSILLEGAVIGEGGGSGLAVRWNWAFVKGNVGQLRERIGHALGADVPFDPACVILVNPGVAYSLTGAALADPDESERRVERIRLAAARAEVVGREEPAEGPPLERLRAHERVRLDAPCRMVFRDADARGKVYNIAREGVFVLTNHALPFEGDEIVVRIVVRKDGRRAPIDLCGIVRWRAESTTAASGGGFGVHVTAVRDPDEGRIFEGFIERLLAHHYAAESAQDWAPLSADCDYEIDAID